MRQVGRERQRRRECLRSRRARQLAAGPCSVRTPPAAATAAAPRMDGGASCSRCLTTQDARPARGTAISSEVRRLRGPRRSPARSPEPRRTASSTSDERHEARDGKGAPRRPGRAALQSHLRTRAAAAPSCEDSAELRGPFRGSPSSEAAVEAAAAVSTRAASDARPSARAAARRLASRTTRATAAGAPGWSRDV